MKGETLDAILKHHLEVDCQLATDLMNYIESLRLEQEAASRVIIALDLSKTHKLRRRLFA